LAAAAGTAGAAGIKQLYQTEVESWRELQSQKKRLREPIEARGWPRLETTVRWTNSAPLGQLVTLEDAGTYITKLPKAEHEAAEWQAATEALILVATSGGPTMFARIGVMRGIEPRPRSRV
jgi:hypothetical protein